MRAARAVDDGKDNACDPQAVHCPSKDLAAVESSGGIDEKGREYEERGNHDQDRRYPLSTVKGLTAGQGNVGDARYEQQQVAGAEDEARDAIEMRNCSYVPHVLTRERKSDQRQQTYYPMCAGPTHGTLSSQRKSRWCLSLKF